MLELVSVAEELRSREPNEQDLKNIDELRGLGWRATAIGSALEMNPGTVRKTIKNLPKPVKESATQKMDREMVGRVR